MPINRCTAFAAGKEIRTHMTRVLFVCAESPLYKTGGMGIAAGELAFSLKNRGHDVRFCTPYYSKIAQKSALNIERNARFSVDAPIFGINRWADVIEHTDTSGLDFYFIDYNSYFGRPGVYGDGHQDYFNNMERFGFFCKAALEIPRKVDWHPDIIHCHDWSSALLPVMLKTAFSHYPDYGSIKTVLTMHNASMHGPEEDPEILRTLGLPEWLFDQSRPGEGLEYFQRVNALVGGLRFADGVSTVSPNYASEIVSDYPDPNLPNREAFQMFLMAISRTKPFAGILNGHDYENKSLLTNPHLSSYVESDGDPSDLTVHLRSKHLAKEIALKEFGLDRDPGRPLIGVIGRIDPSQKGFDLVADALSELAGNGMSFVLTGTGDKALEQKFSRLQGSFPKSFHFVNRFDYRATSLILGGSDFIYVPSRWEPCGLVQMEALAHLAIPIVRQTGGLADTIIDIDTDDQRGNGFTFADYSPQALIDATMRAVAAYRDPERRTELLQRALNTRFLWDDSARQYEDLYQEVLR